MVDRPAYSENDAYRQGYKKEEVLIGWAYHVIKYRLLGYAPYNDSHEYEWARLILKYKPIYNGDEIVMTVAERLKQREKKEDGASED